MAYHDYSHPSAVLSREITATRRIFDAVAGFFAGLGSSITFSASAQSRFDQMQALHAKSDDELAAMNIKRTDIVHLVFKDLYYV